MGQGTVIVRFLFQCKKKIGIIGIGTRVRIILDFYSIIDSAGSVAHASRLRPYLHALFGPPLQFHLVGKDAGSDRGAIVTAPPH